MKYYFAPLEGITNYVYRNIHADCFGKADKYFTPFLSPNQNKCFSSRELNDVKPENNKNLNVVPQLLTNNAEHFLWACDELKKMGYSEVNLNLGCPSMTVVTKKKGSGFLTELYELDKFLYTIYDLANVNISIKTRLGRYSADEFEEILDILNKYPVYELTVHPRVQTDFYKEPVNKKAFEKYKPFVKADICYNGDVFSYKDAKEIENSFNGLNAIMLGRGVIANPALIREIKQQKQIDIYELKQFHDALYNSYKQTLFGDIPVIHKMKELWSYMKGLFKDSDDIWKKIKKVKNLNDYNIVIKSVFECEFVNM